jgi:hypothetical protein
MNGPHGGGGPQPSPHQVPNASGQPGATTPRGMTVSSPGNIQLLLPKCLQGSFCTRKHKLVFFVLQLPRWVFFVLLFKKYPRCAFQANTQHPIHASLALFLTCLFLHTHTHMLTRYAVCLSGKCRSHGSTADEGHTIICHECASGASAAPIKCGNVPLSCDFECLFFSFPIFM